MADSIIERNNPFNGMMKYEHMITMNDTDLIIHGVGKYQNFFILGQSAIMGTVMSNNGSNPSVNLSSPKFTFTVTHIDAKTLRIHFSSNTHDLSLSVYSELDFSLTQETPS